MCVCLQEKSRWLVTNGCVLQQQPRNTVLIDEPHIPLAHLEDTLEGEYVTSGVHVSVPVVCVPLSGRIFILTLCYIDLHILPQMKKKYLFALISTL
jgi:hypothetical protein